MEVATAHHQVAGRENGGIVGNGINLRVNHARNVIHAVAYGAMNLRYATEGIGILNGLVAAVYYLAVFEDMPDYEGCFGLSLMRANLLYARHERVDAAVECLHTDGGKQVEAFHHFPAVDECLDAVGAHKLSTVEQCQSLFRLKGDGAPAEDIQNV